MFNPSHVVVYIDVGPFMLLLHPAHQSLADGTAVAPVPVIEGEGLPP